MKRGRPTQEEIAAARVKQREGRKMIREAWRVLKKTRRLFKGRRRHLAITPDDTAFETWRHDYGILLKGALRARSSDEIAPERLAAEVMAMADRMAAEVEARRPGGRQEPNRRSYGISKRAAWLDWQDRFDGFVHELSDRSTLTPAEIVERAASLTDAMAAIVASRRPTRSRKSPSVAP